jgi:hypothetical protein
MITNIIALSELRPGEEWTWRGDDYSGLEWLDSTSKPTSKQISDKRKELEDAEPMQVLRMERNARLAETDFYALSDVTMSDAMETYRQNLRDLPASSSPTLSDKGVLGNVTWPTKP